MNRTEHTTGHRSGIDADLVPVGTSVWWRAAVVALAALLVLAAVAGAWWLIAVRGAAPPSGASAELTALDAKLTQVRGAITPIAQDFATEPTSGAIDVEAYRTKIDRARVLVDGVNGMEITDADALEVRDLLVTGGSEVLAGMDAALDALVADDATATGPAAIQIDDGLSKLQEADDLIDKQLGRSSVTRRAGGHRDGGAARS